MMRYYRALKDLSTGHKRYDLVPETALKPEAIPILVQTRAIGPLLGPPLSDIPGWQLRARRLAPHGIIYAHDVLEGDHAQIAAIMRVRESTVARWEAELLQWFQPGPPPPANARRRK